jgi:oligosaccharide repeat unit polymerase
VDITYKLLLVTPYLIQLLILYLLWPSSKNIIFIKQLPFYTLAYFGGAFFLTNDAIFDYSLNNDNIELLIIIMMIGTICYISSIIINYKRAGKLDIFIIRKIDNINVKVINKSRVSIIIASLSLVGILFYIYSYTTMGFTPFLADDWMMAKYFGGEYQETYRGVAHFYRIALNLYTITAPFLIIYLLTKGNILSKIIYAILLISITFLTLLSLRRGLIAEPIILLILLFFIFYKNGKYLFITICCYFIIFAVGSSLNVLYYFIQGKLSTIDISAILEGVPDITDLLWFWDRFIGDKYGFSYGKTIYGGLIPYHYDWNPSVLTKLVIGADKNVGSGGFRLPFQVEGYYTFGVVGTIIWSLYAGYVDALQLKLFRYTILSAKNSFYRFYITIFFINIIVLIAKNLICMNIDSLFVIVVGLFIIKNIFYRDKNYPYADIKNNNVLQNIQPCRMKSWPWSS